jgi:hypothetical protein
LACQAFVSEAGNGNSETVIALIKKTGEEKSNRQWQRQNVKIRAAERKQGTECDGGKATDPLCALFQSG